MNKKTKRNNISNRSKSWRKTIYSDFQTRFTQASPKEKKQTTQRVKILTLRLCRVENSLCQDNSMLERCIVTLLTRLMLHIRHTVATLSLHRRQCFALRNRQFSFERLVPSLSQLLLPTELTFGRFPMLWRRIAKKIN